MSQFSKERRRLLKVGGAWAFGATWFSRAALANTEKNTLVCVFLRGGIDGLSIVVPHAEQTFYKARRNIAIARPKSGAGAAIDLDGQFGLHPALKPLHALYKKKVLALVHAVGSPHPTRSHFDAQDYMESGSPGRTTPDGWLNRCLSRTGAPFQGIATSANLPRTLRGAAPTLSIGALDRFGFKDNRASKSGSLGDGFAAMYKGSGDTAVLSAGRAALDAAGIIERVQKETAPLKGFPKGSAGKQLSDLARMLRAGLDIRAATVDVGGFDTHTGQGNGKGGRLTNALSPLGQALSAFYSALGDRMERVVVLVVSEFGRTVKQNGSGGTDHGHGTAMMALGGPIKGGQVYGKWPGLTALHQGRDLPVTTDFRDLFGEIATKHLGANAKLFSDYALRKERQLGLIG